MTRRVTAAVIGLGWGADTLLPALRQVSEIDVVAVGSNHIERAQAVAQEFGIDNAYDDFRDVVARPDLDLVCVCTPPATHFEIADATLKAGKHVFTTKPLGSSPAEAGSLRDDARAHGVLGALDLGRRYVPLYRYVRDLVADGYLGDLRFVSDTAFLGAGVRVGSVAYYASWHTKRPYGGILRTSFMNHHLDLLRYLFGEVDNIAGIAATLVREKPVLEPGHASMYGLDPASAVTGTEAVDAEDAVVIHGSFAGGAPFSLSGTWSVHNGSGERLEVYGSAGTLVIDSAGVLWGGSAAASGLEVLDVPNAYALEGAGAKVSPADLSFGAGRTQLFASLGRDLARTILGLETPGLFATFDDGFRLAEISAQVLGPVDAGSG